MRVRLTLAAALQDVLHLLHRHLQNLCVLHLRVKLQNKPRAPSEAALLLRPYRAPDVRALIRTHVCVCQQSPQLLQTLVDARSPLLLHQRFPDLRENRTKDPAASAAQPDRCGHPPQRLPSCLLSGPRRSRHPPRTRRCCRAEPTGPCWGVHPRSGLQPERRAGFGTMNEARPIESCCRR